MKRTLLAVLLTVAASASQAAVVTFPTPGMPAGNGITYHENGLTFTSSYADPIALFFNYAGHSWNADPTGTTLFQNYIGHSLTVTQTGGGSFFLNSFDLADVYNTGAPSVIPFYYTDSSGTHTSNLTLDNLVGLQTFSFGLMISSFKLDQILPGFQIDNVVFNSGGQVPEPASLALMGLGLAGLAALRRRKGA